MDLLWLPVLRFFPVHQIEPDDFVPPDPAARLENIDAVMQHDLTFDTASVKEQIFCSSAKLHDGDVRFAQVLHSGTPHGANCKFGWDGRSLPSILHV